MISHSMIIEVTQGGTLVPSKKGRKQGMEPRLVYLFMFLSLEETKKIMTRARIVSCASILVSAASLPQNPNYIQVYNTHS